MKNLTIHLDKIGRRINERLAGEYAAQGHNLSGDFIRELTHSVIPGRMVEGEMLKHGIFLDRGVSANRIPYSGKSGGGRSDYIQGLIAYAKARHGLTGKAAISRAFQIAATHRKEGMPTSASRRFSRAKGSRRTGFLTKTLDELDAWISTQISIGVGADLDVQIDNMIK